MRNPPPPPFRDWDEYEAHDKAEYAKTRGGTGVHLGIGGGPGGTFERQPSTLNQRARAIVERLARDASCIPSEGCLGCGTFDPDRHHIEDCLTRLAVEWKRDADAEGVKP